MMVTNNPILTDSQLLNATRYIVYEVRMYAATYVELKTKSIPVGWNTCHNALLETHLLHARSLIDFLSKVRKRDDDIIATDYFHDTQKCFTPINDEYYTDLKKDIEKKMLHLTTKPMPFLKSQINWDLDTVWERLKIPLYNFLSVVPKNKFSQKDIADCMEFLSNELPIEIDAKMSSST